MTVQNPISSNGTDEFAGDKDQANNVLANINKQEKSLTKMQNNDSLIGKVVVGRYEIIELIGSGGQGSVYKARQLSLNRMIALKVLRSDLMEDEKIISRFYREAEIASRLDHPNIVSAFDYGTCDETNIIFIAMDYVSGVSLKDLIKAWKKGNNALQENHIERSINIIIQLCKGMYHAHEERGILHRDIKPGNILLTNYDSNPAFVKITDFGISTILLESEELKRLTTTETANPKGTCLYMAPEQFKTGYKPAVPLDIYSIGCVLFELLTGRPPFNGGSDAVTAHMHATEKIPVLELDSVEPIIKSRLNDIINKALTKEPLLRYQSVHDLQADLKKVQMRLNKLRLEKTNGALLFVERIWLFFTKQFKNLLIHLYTRRWTYSKSTVVSIYALIILIALLFASSMLGTFGSHYDMQYQPILREAPSVLPSKKISTLLMDPKDLLDLYIADADAERMAGDLRLALTLYDKAESKAAKLKDVHPEMSKYWLGRMICCLFLDRPKLTILCAPVCFSEFAKVPNSASNINLGVAHAFYGQALGKTRETKEALLEFQNFTKVLEERLRQGPLHSSDELAYACGFAGVSYGKNGDSSLAELLLERSGDYWKTIGLSGKYNLAITRMNLAYFKIKTNQYQEASDLIENAIEDLDQSGETNIGFKNKLRLYAMNLKLKMWVPIIPMFS